MHAPPSVDEGELAVLHQRAADRAHRFVLLPPPPLEEGLLDVSKLTVRVLCKGEDDAVDDPANPGVLDGVVGAAVVLVDGLQPGGRGWEEVWERVREGVRGTGRRVGGGVGGESGWKGDGRRGSERETGRRVGGDQGGNKRTGVVFPRRRRGWTGLAERVSGLISFSAKCTPTRPTIREPRPPHVALSKAATRWSSSALLEVNSAYHRDRQKRSESQSPIAARVSVDFSERESPTSTYTGEDVLQNAPSDVIVGVWHEMHRQLRLGRRPCEQKHGKNTDVIHGGN